MADPDAVDADEAAAFAKDFQAAVNEGGFNPFSLLTGERRFHSVFLAPFSRHLQQARSRFLEQGEGPLLSLVEQFKRNGLEEDRAREQVALLLQAAQGMCVVLLQDDQGYIAIPQLFFGHLEDAWLKQVVELCGPDFPDPDALRASLLGLRALGERQVTFPGLVVAQDGTGDPRRYWLDLGHGLLRSTDEGLFGSHPERLADLAWWVGQAVRAGSDELAGDELYALARIGLLAGDVDGACHHMAALLADFEVEDEDLAVFLDQLVKTAVREQTADRVLRFFKESDDDLAEVLGGCYELELPRFTAHAAALVPEADLLAAAERLQKADRKSFRQDLNREPIWRVGVEPGELIDTESAAEAIDRSVQFVAKRLEQGTIPFHVDGDQVRIPARGLRNWLAVMQRFDLLD